MRRSLTLWLCLTAVAPVVATSCTRAETAAAPTTVFATPSTQEGALSVLVAGDSQAYTLALNGVFGGGAVKSRIVPRAAALLGCGIARGSGRYVDGTPFAPNPECETWPELWTTNYRETTPDLSIIEIGAWEVYDRVVDGRELRVGTAAWQDYLLSELQRGIDILAVDGRPVVLLLEPCYEGPADLGGPPVGDSPLSRIGWVNEMLKQANAKNPRSTRIIDLSELLCPAGRRLQVIDGVQVMDDAQVHYTNEGAELVWRWLNPRLRDVVRAPR